MNNNIIINGLVFSSLFLAVFSVSKINDNFHSFSVAQHEKKIKEDQAKQAEEEMRQAELKRRQSEMKKYIEENKELFSFLKQTPTERKSFVDNIPSQELKEIALPFIPPIANGSKPIFPSERYDKNAIFINPRQSSAYSSALYHYIKNNVNKTVLHVNTVSYRLENSTIYGIGANGQAVKIQNNGLFPYDTLIKTDEGDFSVRNTLCPLPSKVSEVVILGDSQETNGYYMFPIDERSVNCEIIRLVKEGN